VPLDRDACAALNTYLDSRKAQEETLTANTPVFINYSRDPKVRGKRLSYDGVYLVIKQLGQAAIASALEQIPNQPEVSDVVDSVGWEIAALADSLPTPITAHVCL
jgi:hypothetical protein